LLISEDLKLFKSCVRHDPYRVWTAL